MAFTKAYTFPALYGGPGPTSFPLSEAASVTDTLSVSLTDSSSLIAFVSIAATDTLSVSLTESSSLTVAEYDLYRTRPALYGGPGPYVQIDNKTIVTTFNLDVSDILLVQWQEEPVDEQEIISGDTLRLSLNDVSSLRNSIDAVDQLRVSLSETIGLIQSGVTLKTASDTLSVSVTDSSSLYVTLAVTDTVSVSVTDTSSLATPVSQIDVTDTLSVSISEDRLLGVFTGILDVLATDTLTCTLTESASVINYVPPPVVRPYRIRIVPRTARIRIITL